MAARISSQVFECFLKCRYKAALKLIGEAGQQSAFELFERECQASQNRFPFHVVISF